MCSDRGREWAPEPGRHRPPPPRRRRAQPPPPRRRRQRATQAAPGGSLGTWRSATARHPRIFTSRRTAEVNWLIEVGTVAGERLARGAGLVRGLQRQPGQLHDGAGGGRLRPHRLPRAPQGSPPRGPLPHRLRALRDGIRAGPRPQPQLRRTTPHSPSSFPTPTIPAPPLFSTRCPGRTPRP